MTCEYALHCFADAKTSLASAEASVKTHVYFAAGLVFGEAPNA